MFAFARFLWTVCIALLASASAYAADLEVESDCTLASAIAAANSDSVIGGCPAGDGADSITLSADITLDAPLPRVTSEIAIEGGGHTISAAEQYRHFFVESSGALTITELTLTLGSTDGRGGAIYNKGSLSINDSTISSSVARRFGGAIANWGQTSILDTSFRSNASRYGGAIYNRSGASLSIDGGAFLENEAAPLDGSDSTAGIAIDIFGGALYNHGAVDIVDSSFSDNQALGHGGAIVTISQADIRDSTFIGNIAEVDAGAIFNTASLSIDGSTFIENKADGNYGGVIVNHGSAQVSESDFISNLAPGSGGAIANWGSASVSESDFTGNTTDTQGGAIFSLGELTISDSKFRDNASADGGAIDNRDGGSALINDSDFTGNTSERFGGAILNLSAGQLTVTASDFRDNAAAEGGGALYTVGHALIDDSKFRDNTTQGFGGALVNGGAAEVRASSFRDNTAAEGEGGGVRNFGAPFTQADDNKFASNSGGDCVGCSGETAAVPPAAAALMKTMAPARSSRRTSRVRADIVVGGACTLGNAIRAANVDSAIGGCAAGDGADVIGLTGDITLSAALPKIESQITIEGGGHTISGNERFRIFLVAANGDLTVKEMTLTKGKARDGATICMIGDASTSAFGGAICNYGKLNVVDSEFLDNSAYSGGAIGSVGSRAEATVAASVFTNNSARFGGAIHNTGGATTTITASEFTNNRAGEKGGAIRRPNGTVTQTGNIFINNRPDNCSGMSC